jgi:putative phage-type endonuclease
MKNWEQWRNEGIGSSDAPVIMQRSPWKTPYQLWEEKTGLRTFESTNWATQRGHRMEPMARAHIEFMLDREFPPVLAEHPTFNFLRASLDGYCKETNTILEIKCPGAEDHAKAREGNVPEKYYPQLQHQLLVTGAEKAIYLSFTESDNATVIVHPDQVYLSEYFIEACDFWNYVKTKEPPPLIEQDWRSTRSKALRLDLEEYHAAYLIDGVRAEYLGSTRNRRPSFKVRRI